MKEILIETFWDEKVNKYMQYLQQLRYETYVHSISVASVATQIGLQMHFDEHELKTLCKGAMLHDIGKLFISHDTLLKPSSLTIEEYQDVKNHSEYGYNYLKGEFSENILSIILNHHEKLNGVGYPNQITNIDILTQIVTVADIYDALTNRDTYKEKYSATKALKLLYADAAQGEINETIVDVLAKMLYKNDLEDVSGLFSVREGEMKWTMDNYLSKPLVM